MNVTVSTYTNAIEAHITRGRLEVEGVPAFVAFEHHIWMRWTLSVALGGVLVQVPPSYVDKAAEIITNINTGKYESALEEEIASSDPINCPCCSSERTVRVNWPWKAALLAMFLLAIPIPYTQHLMKCETCSHTWVASEQRGYSLSVRFLSFVAVIAIVSVLIAIWCYWCSLYCELPICV